MTPLSFDTWIELSLKGTIVLCRGGGDLLGDVAGLGGVASPRVGGGSIARCWCCPALSVVVPDVTLPVSFAALATTPPVVAAARSRHAWPPIAR